MQLEDGKTMKTWLYDIQVGEITLCKGHAVPDAQFAVLKSTSRHPDMDMIKWNQDVVFKAFNDEKQIAYGYVLVPDKFDVQDDIVTVEDVEKAAHGFMKALANKEATGTGAGYEHQIFDNIGYPVESAIDRDGNIAKSFGVPDDQIHPQSWWVGVKMSDEMWALTKSGEITGFSIGGTGQRKPYVEKRNIFQVTKVKLKDRLSKLMGSDGKLLEKAMTYNDIIGPQEILEKLINKMWALDDALWSIIDDPEVSDKVGKMEESINQFIADLNSLKANKSQENHIEGELDMTEEQVAKLDETINKLTEAVTKLVEKDEAPPSDPKPDDPPADPPADPPEDPPEGPSTDDDRIAKLEKKTETLVEAVEKFTKATPGRKSDDGTDTDGNGVPVKKSLSEQTKGTGFSFRV